MLANRPVVNPASADKAASGEISAAIGELKKLRISFGENTEALEAFMSKAWGPSPEGNPGPKPREVPSGALATLKVAVDELFEIAERQDQLIGRLREII